MRSLLRKEWSRAVRAASTVDVQTAVVLSAAALLVILQMQLGDRGFFRDHLAGGLEEPLRGLYSWAWWFGMQGVLGFLVPIIILMKGFGLSARKIGLGLGEWRLALGLAAGYLPLVIVGTWFLSDGDAFLRHYPHFSPAARDWGLFLTYEAFFLAYWFGWEYLWRGFVLFGTAHRFGVLAIFVQAMPFAILHFNKPFAEAGLSLIGGIALGALVWRCRSFWIAIPIHAFQMLILDLWCSLRVHSGVRGTGLQELFDVLTGGW